MSVGICLCIPFNYALMLTLMTGIFISLGCTKSPLGYTKSIMFPRYSSCYYRKKLRQTLPVHASLVLLALTLKLSCTSCTPRRTSCYPLNLTVKECSSPVAHSRRKRVPNTLRSYFLVFADFKLHF